MKALTLYQPWASLMAMGVKKNETRPRRTNHRGPLAIHAAKSVVDVQAFFRFKAEGHFRGFNLKDLPLWAVVAIVDVKDCIKITEENRPQGPELIFGDYTPGRFMYRTELVKVFKKPIPMSGKQGFWNIDDEALRVCRVCGCSEFNACMTDNGPCHWVEKDLCSACQFTFAGGPKLADLL